MLVRQAFAAAIDREAIVRIALENGVINPRAATTLTPPETLGRDLFNAVGVPFHPATGRQLLSQAGYTDLSNFPPVTLMTLPGRDSFQIKIAEEMVRMWKIYLDITVNLEVVSEKYFDRAGTDPTEIFWVAQAADYNDPDDFLLEIFHTGSQLNINHFSNAAFDELVELAAATSDPAARQELYIQAERILCEQEVALIPLYHVTYNIP
jgi:ABC-type transport system substrate-binding protein